MKLIFNVYKGFNNRAELIDFLKRIDICSLDNVRVVLVNNQYYAVAIESTLKEIIIAKEQIWFIDKYGYLSNCSINEFNAPYKINSISDRSGKTLIYDEYIKSGGKISLYKLTKDEIFILINNNNNNHILFLLNTFIDLYYLPSEFEEYNYSSLKIKNLIRRDILNLKEIHIVNINPFKSIVKIKINDEIIQTKYRAVIDNVSKQDELKPAIVGFQLYPLIFKNEKEIIDVFKKQGQEIENLAKNKLIELSKVTINYLISENIDMSIYLSKIERKRVNEILSKNGHAIKFIDNPTYTMIIIALENDYSCICDINCMDVSLYENIVKEYTECYKYLEYMNEDIQIHVLEKDISKIKYLKNISQFIISRFLDNINYDQLSNKNNKMNYLNAVCKKHMDNKSIELLNSINKDEIVKKYRDCIGLVKKNGGYISSLLDDKYPFNIHLNVIYNLIECEKAEIATGYVYDTGLYLINDMLLNLINRKKEIKIIAGVLGINSNNNLIKYNENSLRYINNLIDMGVVFKTSPEKLFHGKIYILYGENISCVIIGSSNLSSGGFVNNIETNTIMFFSNYSLEFTQYKEYYERIWNKFEQIRSIDISSREVMITGGNEEKENDKRKFDYLYDENPDQVIEDAAMFKGCLYENEYSAFLFKKYSNMLILDSLIYENAIYIFINIQEPYKFLSKLQSKEVSKDLMEYDIRINHSKDSSHITRVKEEMLKYQIVQN